MRRIILFLTVTLFFSPLLASGNNTAKVDLWKSGQLTIQSSLNRNWRALEPEELAALSSAIPADITRQSGKVVASFKYVHEKYENRSFPGPQIIVFVKTGEHVDQEMIQKTYTWLKKNENLLTGILTEKTAEVSIQDIEYKQNLPAIIFQNHFPVNDHLFSGISTILFFEEEHLKYSLSCRGKRI